MVDHAIELKHPRIRLENLSKVARQLAALSRTSRAHRGAYKRSLKMGLGAGLMHLNSPRLQRVIVKVAYAKNTQNRSWAAHGKYLQRENAKEQGQKSLGFHATNDPVNIQSRLQEWQKSEDPHFFKIILAPDLGHHMDLLSYARRFMDQVQNDLGRPVEWMAIDHHNTDHKHVHILIRGIDKQGDPLILDPNYIAQGLRSRSQELATQILGLRTLKDRELVRQNQIACPRLTEIDRSLRFKANTNVVSFSNLVPQRCFARKQRLQEIARLHYLESIGLVTKIAVKKWRLHDDLEDSLRAMQLSGDIIKSRAQDKLSRDNSSSHLSPTLITDTNPLIGRVVGMGLENEIKDTRYLLVEDFEGKTHYIRATNAIIKARDQRQFFNNDIISLEESHFQKNGKKVPFIKLENFKTMEGLLNASSSLLNDYLVKLVKTAPAMNKGLDCKSLFKKAYLLPIYQRINELFDAKILTIENNKISLSPDYDSKLVELKLQRINKSPHPLTQRLQVHTNVRPAKFSKKIKGRCPQ